MRAAGPIVLLIALLCAAAPAAAQAPFGADEPWHLIDEGRVFGVEAELSGDDVTDWGTRSLGFLVCPSTGGRGRVWLRWRFRSFDDGGLAASDRWPDIVDAEADAEDLAAWRDERRHAGWGRPELGMLGDLRLPGAGALDWAGTAWLPFAANALYPFASRSISVRFSLRKRAAVASGVVLVAGASRSESLTAAGELLSDEAAGVRDVLELGAVFAPAPGWRLGIRWRSTHGDSERWRAYQGEASHLFEGRGTLAASWSIVAGGEEARPWSYRAAVAWRIPLGGDEPESGEEEQHEPTDES